MIIQEQTFVAIYQRFKASDPSARDEIVPLFEPIVNSAVRKFVGRGRRNYPMDDFIQEGWSAVFLALSTYDIERFPTLVRSYFYNAVIVRLQTVNYQTHMVKFPRPLERFMRDVNLGKVNWALSDEVLQTYYPLINLDDIRALRLQQDTSVFDVVLTGGDLLDGRALRSARQAGKCFGDGSGETLLPEERTINRMVARDVLFWFLSQLTEREYQIFVLRFVDEKSKTAIAKELGCSVATVDRIEKSLLSKR